MKNEYRIRNRYFCAILYEDDVNFNKYMDNIKNNYKEVTYIRHDKDITENNELKKAHYHIIFKVGENARSLKNVAKEIEIPENYLQGCKKTAMLRYLIHLDNPEKTQYSIEEVKGELKAQLAEILVKQQPEDNKLALIMEPIIKRQITTINELMIFGIESGLYDVIRKYQYILIKTIEERKKDVYKRLSERDRERQKENSNY